MHSTADTPCCLVLTTSKPATASPVPGMHDERVCTPSYWRSRRRQQHNSPARHAPVRAHNHAREWWRAGGEPAVASERVRRRWCMYWGSRGRDDWHMITLSSKKTWHDFDLRVSDVVYWLCTGICGVIRIIGAGRFRGLHSTFISQPRKYQHRDVIQQTTA